MEKQGIWRESIKTTKILKKLGHQVLAEFTKELDENDKPVGALRGSYVRSDGEIVNDIVPMTAQQVRVAEMLLNRTLPAIKIIEMDANITSDQFLVIAPSQISEKEWEAKFGNKS